MNVFVYTIHIFLFSPDSASGWMSGDALEQNKDFMSKIAYRAWCSNADVKTEKIAY